MNVREGDIAGFPITTTNRGLISKVSPKTKAMLEEALSDPETVQAMKDAGIKLLQLRPHKGPGTSENGWTMGHSDGALMFHTQTGNKIHQSSIPERKQGGIARVIHHEAGHGLWDKASDSQRKAFSDALEKHPDVKAEIAKIVNINPPKDAWNADVRARNATEVHAELNAMRKYDPARFAAMPEDLRVAADAISRPAKPDLYSRVRSAVQAAMVERYGKDQPRVPAGSPEGGQFVRTAEDALMNLRHVRGSDHAKAAAKAFINTPLTNRDSNITASVSGKSLGKMLNKSSWDKSLSSQAHMQAVGNLDRLFPHAIHRLSRPDRSEGKTIKAMHHFDVPMPFDGDVVRVKILAKEHVSETEGTRLYDLTAVEIEEPSVFRTASTSSESIPVPPAGFSQKFDRLLKAVKQRVAGAKLKDTEHYSLRSRIADAVARTHRSPSDAQKLAG